MGARTVGGPAALRLALVVTALAGCAGSVRLERPVSAVASPVAVLRPAWERRLASPEFMSYKPQEWSTATFGRAGVVYVGSSSQRMEALRPSDGRLLWVVHTGAAVASEPLYHVASDTLFFGADDGHMYAVHGRTGRIIWKHATQGTVNPRPAYSDGLLLFSTSAGRVYALDARSGKWRWQYDRELPEGFTIHGYSGVRVAGKRAYVGFPDGVLVCLSAGTGEVVWSRPLREEGAQFVDVDATPHLAGGHLLAASHSGGVYALDPDSGAVRWNYPITGAAGLEVAGGRVFVTAPREGLLALDLSGRRLWRQALAEGVPSAPVARGEHVFVSTTERGLYVASARSGRLLQVFDPGTGISARAAVGDRMLAVVGNSGSLFAFWLGRK